MNKILYTILILMSLSGSAFSKSILMPSVDKVYSDINQLQSDISTSNSPKIDIDVNNLNADLNNLAGILKNKYIQNLQNDVSYFKSFLSHCGSCNCQFPSTCTCNVDAAGVSNYVHRLSDYLNELTSLMSNPPLASTIANVGSFQTEVQQMQKDNNFMQLNNDTNTFKSNMDEIIKFDANFVTFLNVMTSIQENIVTASAQSCENQKSRQKESRTHTVR